MFKSIPLEDSASQQTICDFDVSNVPVILSTTELDPIEGIEESLGHNSSPNTSIQSSASSGFLTPTTASGSNSSERMCSLNSWRFVSKLIFWRKESNDRTETLQGLI